MQNVRIVGMERALRELQRRTRDVEHISKQDIRDIALDLQGKAQDKTPVDTGALKASARTKFKDTSSGYQAEVSFNTPYALRQHEDLSLRHETGEAKFLENALKENLNRYVDKIRSDVRRGLT